MHPSPPCNNPCRGEPLAEAADSPVRPQIANLAGVGPATVDRVINGRKGVRDKTRERVLAAVRKLSQPIEEGGRRRIGLLCEPGATLNAAMAEFAA